MLLGGKPRAWTGCRRDQFKLFDPPPELRLGTSFYKKYRNVDGIVIASSGRVADAALQAVADIVSHMLAPQPNVRKHLIAANLHVAIIGASEKTTDIPEHARLKNDDWRPPCFR